MGNPQKPGHLTQLKTQTKTAGQGTQGVIDRKTAAHRQVDAPDLPGGHGFKLRVTGEQAQIASRKVCPRLVFGIGKGVAGGTTNIILPAAFVKVEYGHIGSGQQVVQTVPIGNLTHRCGHAQTQIGAHPGLQGGTIQHEDGVGHVLQPAQVGGQGAGIGHGGGAWGDNARLDTGGALQGRAQEAGGLAGVGLADDSDEGHGGTGTL